MSHLFFQLISLRSQSKHTLEGAAHCLLSSLESKLMTTGLNSFCLAVGFHPQGALDLKKGNIGSGAGKMRTAGRRQGWEAFESSICKKWVFLGCGLRSNQTQAALPRHPAIQVLSTCQGDQKVLPWRVMSSGNVVILLLFYPFPFLQRRNLLPALGLA